MEHMKRRDFLRYALNMGGAILASQITGTQSILAGSERKFKLNVGYLPISDHLILPVSHALDNNDYDGFTVMPYLCKSWDEMLGKVDMGILHAVFMLAPLSMDKMVSGSHLRCVLFGHTNGSVIAVNKTISDAKGLMGKTIGIPHAKSTHRVLLYQYLKSKGMADGKDTRLVKIAPPLTVKSLKAGRIDAYSVAEPWGLKGVNEGVARILEFSKNIVPNHVCCLVMVKKRVIEKKPDVISQWVNSLREAGKFIHSDPDKAGLLQEPYMKHKPEDMSQIVKDNMISYMDLTPDRERLRTIHDLALECGVLSEKCDLDQFVDNRFA